MDDIVHENAKLRRELQLCIEERDRLRALQPFKRGLEGERYIADLIGGEVTITNARHDIVTKSGHHLEVKLGGLRVAVKGKKTKQWAWRHVFGEDGKKIYDQLILLGLVDERHRKSTDGPYVIFDIPYSDAIALLPNPRYLAISTDADRSFSKVSAVLFEKYLTTETEMRRTYGAVQPRDVAS
ncbi:MAG: hypothetical protein V7609_1051 [Verrucomicrobiota bacterium]